MTKSEQIQRWLDSPYQPEIGTGVDTKERIAKAMEYSAYHLYYIDKKLDQLISETAGVASMVMLYSGKDSE